jgi:hypothetical protein
VTVRIVQPADGTSFLSFPYGDGVEHLTKGQILDVEPGSAAEAAIGVANLTPLNAVQLADAANGGAGAVTN